MQNSEPVQATVPRTKAWCEPEARVVEGWTTAETCGFRDVDEQKILHRGGAEVAVAILIDEISGDADLRGSDAATNDGGADGEVAGLLLRDDAEMIAMEVGGEEFGFGGIELIAEFRLDGREERFGSPTVLKEEIFEARFVAGLAEDFAFAKDVGDRADDGNHLVPLDKGV